MMHPMQTMAAWVLFCTGLAWMGTGCELPETDDTTTSPPANEATEASSTNSTAARESSFDYASATWLGPAYPNTTRDERAVLHSATIDRSTNIILLDYDPLPTDWPKQVNAAGQLVMFEQLSDGSWRGGRVEWLDPGQSLKSLDNIDNGYNGWTKPPAGATMAISILSTDGLFCSNTILATY